MEAFGVAPSSGLPLASKPLGLPAESLLRGSRFQIEAPVQRKVQELELPIWTALIKNRIFRIFLI